MTETIQTEEEIIIIINVNQSNSNKPDILIMKNFVKFYQFPNYFERFLCNEINETDSYCKIYPKKVKIILKKNCIGIWSNIFENLSKDERKLRKQNINQELEKLCKKVEREAVIKRSEIKKQTVHYEIKRDTKQRQEIESVHKKISALELCEKNNTQENIKKDFQKPEIQSVRKYGKIKFCFSDFIFKTPKRESQSEENQTVSLKDELCQ